MGNFKGVKSGNIYQVIFILSDTFPSVLTKHNQHGRAIRDTQLTNRASLSYISAEYQPCLFLKVTSEKICLFFPKLLSNSNRKMFWYSAWVSALGYRNPCVTLQNETHQTGWQCNHLSRPDNLWFWVGSITRQPSTLLTLLNAFEANGVSEMRSCRQIENRTWGEW